MEITTLWAKNGTMDQPLKKAIRFYRVRAGLTQEECAARAHMSQAKTWNSLERARSQPISLTQLKMVADAVDVAPEDILRKEKEFRQE